MNINPKLKRKTAEQASKPLITDLILAEHYRRFAR
jgi:hypothetical protein